MTDANGVRRRVDWAARLEAAVLADLDRPFAWHDNDCASSVCRWIAAMTGADLFAPFRKARLRYRGGVGAAGALVRFGEAEGVAGDLAGVAEALARRHGLPAVAPALAQRGDVALIEGEEGPTLGLVYLDGRRVIKQAETGVLFLGRRALLESARFRAAWQVPF